MHFKSLEGYCRNIIDFFQLNLWQENRVHVYFKRKQSNKSVAGHVGQSQASITAGFCGFDVELCQQSEMCKALNPATVIQGTNYKYHPLAWQSRTSCIIRVFFLLLWRFLLLSLNLWWNELSLISQRRQSAKDLCVLFTAVQTDRPYRSQGPSDCCLNGIHKLYSQATVVWLDHHSLSPNYVELQQKQKAEKALCH